MGATQKFVKIVIDHDDNHILVQEDEHMPRGSIVFVNGNPIGVAIHDATISRVVKDEPLYPPLRQSNVQP